MEKMKVEIFAVAVNAAQYCAEASAACPRGGGWVSGPPPKGATVAKEGSASIAGPFASWGYAFWRPF